MSLFVSVIPEQITDESFSLHFLLKLLSRVFKRNFAQYFFFDFGMSFSNVERTLFLQFFLQMILLIHVVETNVKVKFFLTVPS